MILRRTRIDGSLFLSFEMVGSLSSWITSDLTMERASLARGSLSTVILSSSRRESLCTKSEDSAGSSPFWTFLSWEAASLGLWANSALSETLPVFSSRKSPAGESIRYAFKTLLLIWTRVYDCTSIVVRRDLERRALPFPDPLGTGL